MIVVAGFNTSVDRYMVADAVAVGGVTRVRDVIAGPGGKGAHVAFAIATLGEPVRLVGIIDELHRDWFQRVFAARGVQFDAVPISGAIRTCLTVRDREARTTELLEPGPTLTLSEQSEVLDRFRSAASAANIIVLSGSLPAGIDASTYAEMAADIARPDVRVLLDASGDVLKSGLAARPFLVKPNAEEAGWLIGHPVNTIDEAHAAAATIASHVSAAVVSLGARGIVGVWNSRQCRVSSPILPHTGNAVGSGDCLVGGIAVALARGADATEALQLGVACGAANALTSEAGLIRLADVETLRRAVDVRWL